MVWCCPECGAMNFAKGCCECCGYGGNTVKVSYGTSTGEQLPKEPEYVCSKECRPEYTTPKAIAVPWIADWTLAFDDIQCKLKLREVRMY